MLGCAQHLLKKKEEQPSHPQPNKQHERQNETAKTIRGLQKCLRAQPNNCNASKPKTQSFYSLLGSRYNSAPKAFNPLRPLIKILLLLAPRGFVVTKIERIPKEMTEARSQEGWESGSRARAESRLAGGIDPPMSSLARMGREPWTSTTVDDINSA